jgi:hypothetical protein
MLSLEGRVNLDGTDGTLFIYNFVGIPEQRGSDERLHYPRRMVPDWGRRYQR